MLIILINYFPNSDYSNEWLLLIIKVICLNLYTYTACLYLYIENPKDKKDSQNDTTSYFFRSQYVININKDMLLHIKLVLLNKILLILGWFYVVPTCENKFMHWQHCNSWE